jgi:nucleoside-diphosphate-sugar epimerase
MKLFVTGGTGFIGAHFLRQALAAGHDVSALCLPNDRPRINLPVEPRWLQGTVGDDWTEALAGCDALVHLAALGVSPQKAEWPDLLRVNVLDSAQLWLQAARIGIRRLIICGSCFEYGRSGERYERIPVDAPLEPTNAYAASKAAATVNALALAVEQQVELIVLRPFHLFGEGQHPANFWPSLQRAAFAGEDFAMTPGEQIRDFMPVEEVAAAFLNAVARTDLQAGQPRIENLGTGKPQTLRAFAEHWWQTWHATGKLKFGVQPYRPGEVMRYVPQL